MSTANPTTTDGHFDPSHGPHHRRSREEMEALAKNFVATPAEAGPAAAKPIAKIAMAAGGVALLAIVALVAWPAKEEAARPAAQPEAARVAAEAEQWKQRFEAERERKRKELAAGKEYLERIAAADAALVGELAERAARLSERVEPAPAAASDASVPTPREEPARKASAVPSKPAAAASPPATTTASSSAAPKTAPAQAPTTAPEQVAKAAPATQEAPKSSCAIHVSELSSSGKLTYDAVMKMKGARLDESNGHVFTPPVKAAGGRTVVFEVMPDGCVRVGRR